MARCVVSEQGDNLGAMPRPTPNDALLCMPHRPDRWPLKKAALRTHVIRKATNQRQRDSLRVNAPCSWDSPSLPLLEFNSHTISRFVSSAVTQVVPKMGGGMRAKPDTLGSGSVTFPSALRTMAFFVLLPRATRTRIVPADIRPVDLARTTRGRSNTRRRR